MAEMTAYKMIPKCTTKEMSYVVSELVRCKDCKYNDDNECIIKAGWFPVTEDWFCADGTRRDYVKPVTESATDWDSINCE